MDATFRTHHKVRLHEFSNLWSIVLFFPYILKTVHHLNVPYDVINITRKCNSDKTISTWKLKYLYYIFTWRDQIIFLWMLFVIAACDVFEFVLFLYTRQIVYNSSSQMFGGINKYWFMWVSLLLLRLKNVFVVTFFQHKFNTDLNVNPMNNWVFERCFLCQSFTSNYRRYWIIPNKMLFEYVALNRPNLQWVDSMVASFLLFII